MPIKQVSLAVLVCGILDIAYAIVTTMLKGGSGGMVLRGVASGPFGEAVTGWGIGGAALGLAVHFTLMAVIVAVYFALAANTKLGTLSPWLAGAAYGLAVYAVMYLLVLPLRWPTVYPLTDPVKVAMSLFPHLVFVGLPLAFIAARAPAGFAAAAR